MQQLNAFNEKLQMEIKLKRDEEETKENEIASQGEILKQHIVELQGELWRQEAEIETLRMEVELRIPDVLQHKNR